MTKHLIGIAVPILFLFVASALIFGLFKTAPGGNTEAAATVLWQFEKDLYAGLRNNPDVSQLQTILGTEGLYGGPITGNFFELTKAAVAAFQLREYITPTGGYFGPLTRGRLNEILKNRSETANVSGSTNTPIMPSPASTEPSESTPESAAAPNVFTLSSITSTAVSNNANSQIMYATLTFKNDDPSGIVLTRLNFAPLSARANADAYVRGESSSKLTLYNCASDTSGFPSFTNAKEFDYAKATSVYGYIYIPPAATRPVCLKITKVTVKNVTEGMFALPLTGAEIDRTDVKWNATTLNGDTPQEIVWNINL